MFLWLLQYFKYSRNSVSSFFYHQIPKCGFLIIFTISKISEKLEFVVLVCSLSDWLLWFVSQASSTECALQNQLAGLFLNSLLGKPWGCFLSSPFDQPGLSGLMWSGTLCHSCCCPWKRTNLSTVRRQIQQQQLITNNLQIQLDN